MPKIQSIVYRLRRRPAPRAAVAAYLSLRWGCRVSPLAQIDFPDGLRIGRGTWIGECHIVAQGRGISIGRNCEIHRGVILDAQSGEISLGDNTGIGPYTVVYGYGGVRIGEYCAIAGQSMIVASNHRFERRDTPIRKQGLEGLGIEIGRDVWLGANCVVLDGAVIGAGCVFAAGAVVRGAFDAYSVAAGVPARTLRKRPE